MIELYRLKGELKLRRQYLVEQLAKLHNARVEDEYVIALCKGRIFELERIFWDLFPEENFYEEV